MTNKSVHNCQFVHHANFHCIMTTVNKVFKNEFERGELEKSRADNDYDKLFFSKLNLKGDCKNVFSFFLKFYCMKVFLN